MINFNWALDGNKGTLNKQNCGNTELMNENILIYSEFNHVTTDYTVTDFLLRTRELYPGTEMERYAGFSQDALRHVRGREYVPSQEELRAILSRQEMTSTVYCHGGGSCKITINSHTTAGEVRKHIHTHIHVSCRSMLTCTCVCMMVSRWLRSCWRVSQWRTVRTCLLCLNTMTLQTEP